LTQIWIFGFKICHLATLEIDLRAIVADLNLLHLQASARVGGVVPEQRDGGGGDDAQQALQDNREGEAKAG
jgi:hypothetical protein